MAMFTSGPYIPLIAKKNASGIITWNELSEKKKHGTVAGARDDAETGRTDCLAFYSLLDHVDG
jgi:hypothetical protein